MNLHRITETDHSRGSGRFTVPLAVRLAVRLAALTLATLATLLPLAAAAQGSDSADREASIAKLEAEALAALDAEMAHEQTEQPAHYVVIQTIDDDPLNVTHYEKVVMDGALPSRSDTDLATKSLAVEGRQHTTAITRLRHDVTGEVVWQDVVKIPRWLRSEVSLPADDPRIAERGGSNIDGVRIPAVEVTFVVRAPIIDGATTLEVTHGEKNLRATESIDLAALETRFAAASTKAITGAVHEGVPGHFGGPTNNRLDVLFVAEGYTTSSHHWFRYDTDIMADRFFGETPWDRYAPLMNFYRLFVPSNQNGADRPSCPDDDDADGDDANVFVDTAFDATFCSSDIWRLLTVDNAEVLAAAAQYPDWDEIIVVVQTPFRGGSGGTFATTSLGPGYVIDDDITGVMVHEFGHSFGDLADEYDDATPGYPMCSDTNFTSADDCEANVTDVTNRSSVRWNRWIASSTAVPTTFPLTDPTAAGLWEGARYLENGMYRQCFSGKMRNTLSDHCDVDSEALVLELYDGGWGSPSSGVSLIEPGTRVPSSSFIYPGDFESVTVRAKVIGPNGSNVRVRWYRDGALQKTQTVAPFSTPSYTFRSGRAGSFDTIQMKVEELSPFLHSSQRSRSLSTATWYVDVQGCAFC